jgi:hypothetical protein
MDYKKIIMKKTYIIFYKYYWKKSSWCWILDGIEVTRAPWTGLDIHHLNEFVRKKLIKMWKIDNNDELLINNIINQMTI